MLRTNGLRSSLWGIAAMMALCLNLSLRTVAQESGESTSQGSAASQSTKDNSNAPESSRAQTVSPVSTSWASQYFYQIGSAGVLAGNPQGLHLGRLYVPTAEVRGVVDDLRGVNGQSDSVLTGTLFDATVVYDRQFGSNRFAVQYQPRMAIADGRVVSDFSNQNTSLDMIVYSRPRWNVRIHDGFAYFYSQESAGFNYFDVSSITSGTVTNGFLDGPNRWISNTASASISYALSARSAITVTPRYIFSESGESPRLIKGDTFGSDVGWNYRTSAVQSVGLQYSGQLIRENESRDVSSNTIYHSLDATLSRQLSPTWLLTGALGATVQSVYTGSHFWYAHGAFGLVKQFPQSSLAFNYYRGDTLASGLISNQFSDRYDATYQKKLGRRLTGSVGGGYLRQAFSGNLRAWYVLAQAGYLLAPKAGLSFAIDYAHKQQKGSVGSLFVGDHDSFLFGLQWQPARATR